MEIVSLIYLVVISAITGMLITSLIGRDIINAGVNMFSVSIVVSEDHTRETIEYEEGTPVGRP